MPNYTKNLKLILPSKNEKYNVDVANTNNTLIDEAIGNKVDKIPGKSLSTNDFTNGYKTKLDNLENYDDTEVKQDISNIEQEQNTQNTKISNIEQEQTTQNTNIQKNTEDIKVNQNKIVDLQEKHNKEIKELESLIPSRTS